MQSDSPVPGAFHIVREALGDVWSDLWTCLVCDFLWLLGIVLIIPGPPATLALFAFANRQAHDEPTDLGDFWKAFRTYWGPAWRWGLVNLVVILIFVGDIYVTGRGSASTFMRFTHGFYFMAMAAWVLVQLYALPFLLEQVTPSVRLALRNAAVLLGQNPVFSLLLGFCLILLTLIGIPLFLLSVGFAPMLIAAAGNRAVLSRLKKT